MSFDVSLSWLKRQDLQLGQCAIDQKLIKEFDALINYLECCKKPALTDGESVGLLLEHAILVCNSYLDVLHDEQRLYEMMRCSKSHESNLRVQLETSLGLLQKDPSCLFTQREASITAPDYCISQQPKVIHSDEAGLLEQVKPSGGIDIYMLGKCRIFINGVDVAGRLKGKGKLLLKYLVLHRKLPVPKEVLMNVFWPGYDIESARNNLNVAVYGLRQFFRDLLPQCSVIVFSEGRYSINPSINLWTDESEFRILLKKISQLDYFSCGAARLSLIEQAIGLYEGDLLEEDLYIDWLADDREALRCRYLGVLRDIDKFYLESRDYESSIRINKKIVASDHCEESAHKTLIENYKKTGQRHLAIRQFRVCKDALRKELDIEPSAATQDLIAEFA